MSIMRKKVGVVMGKCRWKIADEEDSILGSYTYETDCGHASYFKDGGVKGNKFVWCPFCGREIERCMESVD